MKRDRWHPVYIDDIARVLPVDEWFSKKTFSELTGIGYPGSAGQRLKTLVKQKLLDRKGERGSLKWRMSESQMLGMLGKAEANLEAKIFQQKPRKTGDYRNREGKKINIAAVEVEAYKEDAWRMMHNKGVI